jgi:hypothetical protein
LVVTSADGGNDEDAGTGDESFDSGDDSGYVDASDGDRADAAADADQSAGDGGDSRSLDASDGAGDAYDGGRILFTDNFEDGIADGWTTYNGTWTIINGQYSVMQVAGGPKAVALATSFGDFTLDADVSLNATGCTSDGNAGLIFRVSLPGAGEDLYGGYYTGVNPTTVAMEYGRADNGVWVPGMIVPVGVPAATYHIKVVAVGPHIMIYLGTPPVLKFDAMSTMYPKGAIGVRSHDCTAAFDNIVVSLPP